LFSKTNVGKLVTKISFVECEEWKAEKSIFERQVF